MFLCYVMCPLFILVDCGTQLSSQGFCSPNSTTIAQDDELAAEVGSMMKRSYYSTCYINEMTLLQYCLWLVDFGIELAPTRSAAYCRQRCTAQSVVDSIFAQVNVSVY